jgi:chitinase
MRLWCALFIAATMASGMLVVIGIQQEKPASMGGNEAHQVVGYFTEDATTSGNYTVKSVVTSGAAVRLTQLNYAFGRVADDRCLIADREASLEHRYTAAESVDGSADPTSPNQLRGTFHQLQELKRLYPKLKVMISLGGWGQSAGFSGAAEPDHLREFVRSCVDTFIKGHFASGIDATRIFDGIDLDWEYPVEGGVSPGRPEDTRNFTAMAAEFRHQLDAVRPGLLLTAAVPAKAELYKNFELGRLARYMDQLAIMAYDEHWSTEPLTNLQSSLFHDPDDPSEPPLDKHYGEYAVRGFLDAGVPKGKIIFGVPFYGKGWAGVKHLNHGLYQPASRPADAVAYEKLKTMRGADRQFYPALATCSIWHQGKFWSYDCPEAMSLKMEYIRRQGLGGVMFWELSQDTSDGELLRILAGK